jgi:hypothetical protein
VPEISLNKKHVATERDAARLTYMGESYRCAEDYPDPGQQWDGATTSLYGD